MEIGKLIEDLNEYADWAERCEFNSPTFELEKTLRKAAKTIKLLRECVVEEDNERWHRMIDDMEKNDVEQSS